MAGNRRSLRLFVLLLWWPLVASAQSPVLTRSYDNGRTGANLHEAVLTPDAIASKGLKRVKALAIDDDPRIEAQPLYVPGLRLADGRTRNVVFVASMGNHVYAFDLEAPEGKDLLWKASLGSPYVPATGVQIGGRCITNSALVPESARNNHVCADNDWWGINIAWGILSTPVIDLDNGVMFIANWVADAKGRHIMLHRLRLNDGKEVSKSLAITAQLDPRANPPSGSTPRAVSLFPDQKVRAALLLNPLHGESKTLFLATTGGENPGDPHGWVVAVDAESFKQTAAWVSTPSSFGGGIWQGSQGMAADADGNVYAMTGNGGYIHEVGNSVRDFEGDTDFAEAFVKLKYSRLASGGVLTLDDWFIPFRDSERQALPMYNYKDQDLGSAAPIVPPDSGLLLGAGKDGLLYVLDRSHLGKVVGDLSVVKSAPLSYITFNGLGLPTSGGSMGDAMDFPLGDPTRTPSKTHHLHGSPVYWNGSAGPMLFAWGENDSLRAWSFDQLSGRVDFVARGSELASARLAANPHSMGGMTGGMLTLSSNGKMAHTGIVWATAPIDGDANHDVVDGIVRAYDATELDSVPFDSNTPKLKRLWDSTSAGINFKFSKFCSPVVADGRLLVTTYSGRVDVYGLP